MGVQGSPAPVGAPDVDFPHGLHVRFIREIGVFGRLRIYWDRVRVLEGRRYAYLNDCPTSRGRRGGEFRGSHNAYVPLSMRSIGDWDGFGKVEDYADERWPTSCSDCGEPVPAEHWGDTYPPSPEIPVGTEGIYLVRQVFTVRGYDTPSHLPEPGDIFWRECTFRDADGGKCSEWDNCSGQHLVVICPNGHEWDTDSRASNCGGSGSGEAREKWRRDRTHRCWVREGSPEDGTITIGKKGHTCPAGAGSILIAGYHGMLQRGRFNP